jgi:phosphate transport system permease protein
MRGLGIRKLKSYLMISLITTVSVLALIPIFHLITSVTLKGVEVISRNFPNIFFDVRPIPGSKEVGGIGPYIVGTLIITSLSIPITLTISVLASLYSSEALSRFERFIGKYTRLFTHMLIEFPTIIIGLTVYGLLTSINNLFNINIPRFSLLAGTLALIIIVTPYVYSQVEDALKSIPSHVREAVYSLGVTRVKAAYILLRYIKPALYASITIGVFRTISETAALLFTAFGSDHYPILDSQMLFRPIGTLTLAIYNFALSPYENWIDLSWVAAFTLLIMSTTLFVISKVLSRGR